MDTVILGGGNLGRAIAAGLAARAEPPPRVLGRPSHGRHVPLDLTGAEVVFDASRADAVTNNLAAALAAGCRRFVIATTGWDDARPAIDGVLRSHGAAAVASPNFSLGVAAFLRLVDVATGLLATLPGTDPFLLEWHRREKPDRPSGTALEIARRVIAAHPQKTHIGAVDRAPTADALEVASIRAGASPGMHLVGFDAPGETIELRLTARDRSAYATGALAAADWLRRAPRLPGIHGFDEVVDDLLNQDRRVQS